MTGFDFDVDTQAARLAADRWRLDISAHWNVRSHPNGGYLLAAMLRPLIDDLDKPDLLAVSAHFLRPTATGEAELDVDVIRAGRRHTHLEARLLQGSERVRLLAVFGDLANTSSSMSVASAPAGLPPPERCAGRDELPRSVLEHAEILDHIEARFAPETPWIWGRTSTELRVASWVRFRDSRPIDSTSLLLFADPFPPAALTMGPLGWMPTVELTVHLRARPVAGWLQACFETRTVRNGYLEQDGELWDDSGTLVAQSRQLMLLLE